MIFGMESKHYLTKQIIYDVTRTFYSIQRTTSVLHSSSLVLNIYNYSYVNPDIFSLHTLYLYIFWLTIHIQGNSVISKNLSLKEAHAQQQRYHLDLYLQ